jgi:hypothetical protein
MGIFITALELYLIKESFFFVERNLLLPNQVKVRSEHGRRDPIEIEEARAILVLLLQHKRIYALLF